MQELILSIHRKTNQQYKVNQFIQQKPVEELVLQMYEQIHEQHKTYQFIK